MIQRRVQVHVLVTGAVQGVSFRAFAQRQALDWRLVGWVRNLDEDRVELVAQGQERDVDALVAWCRRGPLHASVEEVTVERMALEAFQGFDVRR